MRNTPLFNVVTDIFKSKKRPISVSDLKKYLSEKQLSPNKTTLYRMLEKMEKSGQIESLLLDAKTTYYEIKTDHHHHFRCHDCEQIKCIQDPKLEEQIHAFEHTLQKKGFQIEEHHFSFSGTCTNCS